MKKTARIAATLFAAEVALILVSWIVTAVKPESGMRSLLSEEGVRWLFGHLMSNLLTPVLAWMLFAAMAYGALKASGILAPLKTPRSISRASYRQRFALQMVALEIIIAIAIMLLLTIVPQAPLLSVTGNLFPSSFSQSIVPVACFCVALFSLTYGAFSGTLTSLTEMFRALCAGIAAAAPLFVVYAFATELYFSLLFVFEIQ